MASTHQSKKQYIEVSYPEPHIARSKKILATHPEVKKLFGNEPRSAIFVYGIVALQIAVAILLRNSPWWAILIAAYTVGAFSNHGLFVLIHECAHNLIYRSSNANRLLGIVANIPIVFPAAVGFRNFHLIHHRRQGELEYDADLSGPGEAGFVGNSTPLKMLWCLFFFLIEGVVRPNRIKKVKVFDAWVITNAILLAVFFVPFVYFFGWVALSYLFLSTVFAIGLHPLGARWIQEHYVFVDKQETYSYYGPLNPLIFNVGYHNEHHDLMMVPWFNLPKLKAMAPEFYDNLHYHTSYTYLMWRFLFSRDVNLFSRVIRPSARGAA